MLPRCAAHGYHRASAPLFVFALVLVLGRATKADPPRYSSRIVEIQTGSIRGVILDLTKKHLEPVEVSLAPGASATIVFACLAGFSWGSIRGSSSRAAKVPAAAAPTFLAWNPSGGHIWCRMPAKTAGHLQ